MGFSLKTGKFRSIYITSRNYCEYKSIYEKHEKGEKPRVAYGKPYLEWRKPWIKREGEWKSNLSVFVEKNPSMHILNAMQQIPDFNLKKLKNWWSSMKDIQEIENQKYLPERVTILGSNLAAVHFFTFRNAKVRLKETQEWIYGDITTLNLPDRYVDGYYVDAVDCTNFHHNGIRYEGLQNLSGLNFLNWLSLRNQKHIDVWCLDRLAGQNGSTLKYLDISGCKLCPGSVFALARMPALKVLIITDPGDNVEMQAALSMLEASNPQLLIKAILEETEQNDRK